MSHFIHNYNNVCIFICHRQVCVESLCSCGVFVTGTPNYPAPCGHAVPHLLPVCSCPSCFQRIGQLFEELIYLSAPFCQVRQAVSIFNVPSVFSSHHYLLLLFSIINSFCLVSFSFCQASLTLTVRYH